MQTLVISSRNFKTKVFSGYKLILHYAARFFHISIDTDGSGLFLGVCWPPNH